MLSPSSFVFCAAWLAAGPALASSQTIPDKAAIRDELFRLDAQIVAARQSQAPQNSIDALLARRADRVAALGGGDPSRAARAAAPSSAFVAPQTLTSVQGATTPLPPGSIASSFSFPRVAGIVIPDGATTTSTVAVSGAGTYLWDVDVFVDISHPWTGDLDIVLIAPSGKRVTLATDVAEGYVDVFKGTLFDDSPDAPAWSYPHANGVNSTPLNPEGALHRLAGENPNGTWTLQIKDDALGDVGTLHSWRLDLKTFAAPPITPLPAAVFSATPLAAIPEFTPLSSTLVVSGLGASTANVRVTVNFTHTWNSDVRFDLVGPNGRRVRLSTFNGGHLDNVFAGTPFFDVMSRLVPTPNPLLDQPIDEYPFANNVAALQAQPEGSLTSFLGDDPNGAWRLEMLDTIGGQTGTLVGWDLAISTWLPPAPPPTPYCPQNGPSALGCQPTITATANPDVSLTTPCIITASNIDGMRSGIVFYGAFGPVLKNWCTGGTGNALLCVKNPIQRTGAQNTAGTMDQCNGSLMLDWNVWQASHPAALGNPWMAGAQAHVQGWFRSPPDCKTTFLTPALELTYQP